MSIDNIKRCPRCKLTKNINEFSKDNTTKSKFNCYCKQCVKEKSRKYYLENKESISLRKKEYCSRNKELELLRHKKYRENNKELISLRNKKYYLENKESAREYSKEHRENNRDKHNSYRKKRHHSDPMIKLNDNMSCYINRALKGNKNGQHWEDIMSYTLKQLKTETESKFLNGMTWGNYGKLWHLHHHIPLSLWKFDSYNDREFKQCWALCNLEPLWAKDNLSRGNKMQSNKENITNAIL